jgi:hypothetical protein
MENKKNKAILYVANNLKAFNPNCSAKPASLEIDRGGGHLGKVKEKMPNKMAATTPMIN